MPPIPAPPADASGGFIVMQYTTATDTHRQRLHVAPFNYPAVPQFVYNPVVGAGVETTPMATFTAYANVWKPAYGADVSLSMLALFQIVGGVPVERFGWTVPAAVAGTSGGAESTDQRRAGFISYNFKSMIGGRARVVLLNVTATAGYYESAKAQFSALGGSAAAFIAYLTSANTGAVCHDGQKFANVGNLTYGLNEKLRRRYGFT